ncbi:MAG TPA: NAD(P)H-binding protein [Streptosporangiaceae bacterium]|jgi:uncharacterized protein YbjT (DUF2867 family)|nr:NAD(P)H-binding protein [Streptosporangiaceae bacterium]
MSEPGVILVTGSTGNVGRSLVSQLLEVGAEVRALARDPGSARLPGGANVVAGDLSRPATLREALDGVGAVFLLWPFTDADAAPAVADVLAGAGPRVVFLSSMGSQAGQAEAGTAFHAAVERELRRSGLAWTFLRPGGFASNTLLWAPQIRTDGVVRWPYARAARSLIHERDIAAVAVRCLTSGHGGGGDGGGGQGGAVHVLTGPEAVTQEEQVHAIGRAVGRPVRYEEIPADAALTQMLADGWPRPFAEHALAHWATLVEQPEPVTDTVKRLTGTAARTFGEWARDHAGDFR